MRENEIKFILKETNYLRGTLHKMIAHVTCILLGKSWILHLILVIKGTQNRSLAH